MSLASCGEINSHVTNDYSLVGANPSDYEFLPIARYCPEFIFP
jgi:hypothetical protein